MAKRSPSTRSAPPGQPAGKPPPASSAGTSGRAATTKGAPPNQPGPAAALRRALAGHEEDLAGLALITLGLVSA
ncbi:MAG TPA: hypothetical protein VF855_14300, partial [Acidimicrobiales bacterium]